MAIPFSLKYLLKQLRWRVRRINTARRWGWHALRAAPAILGNAMPKSGSHLLTQVLHGLPHIGPFVNPGFPPVNRDEANRPLPEKKVFDGLYRMLPGDIRYGYIHAREPYLTLLSAPGRATVFVYRDPRDMLVSHVFYATDLNEAHGMHPYYQRLSSMEERLNAAIEGVAAPQFFLPSVRKRYEDYLAWLDQPEIFCLRFEDLVLEREVALARLLGFLEVRGLDLRLPRPQAIAALQSGIAPRKSGTFRRGQPGEWREHFTPVNIARFKAVAGDLLARLGYEAGEDW